MPRQNLPVPILATAFGLALGLLGACGAPSKAPAVTAEHATAFPIASVRDLGAGVELTGGEVDLDSAAPAFASPFLLAQRAGRSRVKKSCVSAYGKTACGYNCTSGYGQVACASSPMGMTVSAYGTTGSWDPPTYVRRWYRDAGPVAQCVAEYGELACGYGCASGYGKVACAVEPEGQCLAAYGDIACGYDCTAGYGEVKCASSSEGVCVASYGSVTCSD